LGCTCLVQPFSHWRTPLAEPNAGRGSAQNRRAASLGYRRPFGRSPRRLMFICLLADYGLPRSRFAFARARPTNGASIAVCPFPLSNALVDACTAATFSAVIRKYSAGEQVPWDISRERRRIVSQEATVSRAIVMPRPKEFLTRLRMHPRWRSQARAASATPVSLHHCIGRLLAVRGRRWKDLRTNGAAGDALAHVSVGCRALMTSGNVACA
jgi:hypothetical protein